MYEIVFSATGRTQRVVDIITKEWNEDKIKVDLSQRDMKDLYLNKNDVCLIAVPVYGGRIPTIASDHLKKIHGDNTTAIMVVVYGNRDYDDALVELEDVLINQGFICKGAIAAIAQHSMMPQFANGRPDNEDEKVLRDFVKEMKEKINEIHQNVIVPGNRPYKKLASLSITPKANKNCVKCQKCALNCPMGAIPLDKPHMTDKSKCITCMRCVEICPENARELSKTLMKTTAKLMKKQFIDRKENEMFL